MTKIDKYTEIEVTVHSYQGICYWCTKIFLIRKNINNRPIGWREHINIQQETKIFCSKECQKRWINYKQIYGDLMP